MTTYKCVVLVLCRHIPAKIQDQLSTFKLQFNIVVHNVTFEFPISLHSYVVFNKKFVVRR